MCFLTSKYKSLDSTNQLAETFDFHTPLDPEITYTDDIFICDYGKGPKTYKYDYYNVSGTIYVVAKEILKDTELLKLLPFCRCIKCKSEWYNLYALAISRKKAGCLYSPHYSQKILNSTRIHLDNINLM